MAENVSKHRIAELIEAFAHELSIASRNQRSDDYPAMCADTIVALTELLLHREATLRAIRDLVR